MNLSRPLSATGFMGNATNRFMSLLSTTTSSAHPLCFLRRLSRPLSHYHRYHSLSFPLKPPLSRLSHFHSSAADSTVRTSSFIHPWPEWSHLFDTLFANNAADNDYNNDNNNNNEVDSFTVDLPHDFARPAAAYMAFARARPGLLRLLSRRDIQVVVENGTPFLFKNGEDSGRRLRLFLDQGFNNVSDTDKAQTVDLMRFILSYASNHVFSSEQNNLYNREFVESSVRNLLREIAKLCDSASESTSFGAVQNKSPYNYGETPRPFEKSMEMKRGDWICSRCSFMNFARNMKCLECEEARPKRQLTGGEWECPQCDFFNYGRNRVCLRCDCKRPGEVPVGTAKTSFDMRFENGDGANKTDIDSRLAANEEKAQRWFSKISQLDNTADLSSAVSDEDFPEIMPLRKGVNRFVVSTRKTPLERRLANTQYQRNLDKGENSAPRTGTANMSHGAIASQTLDDILGRTSVSESNTAGNISGKNVQTDKPTFITSSASTQNRHPRGSNSNYAPFVPLPADAFAKKPENSEDSVLLSESSTKQAGNKNEDNEQAEKSERWFKRVAELHDVTDLASAISDEDFPEIMPLRKGENRFVVSKKKDRSLISPAYKKGTVMEQANNANNVPFVPFPPDYFAKSDNQERNGTNLDSKSADVSTPTTMAESSPDRGPEKLNIGHSKQLETPQTSVASWNSGSSRDNLIKNKTNSVYDPLSSGNSSLKSVNPSIGSTVRMNDGSSRQEEGFNKTVNSGQQYREQENKQSWTGKSLEGSAVKETDPLDMSEEAKAERWFKRVAQINDISELSQIPDEDFPSIMPMRKGVNRFVVSKRKTPLERRLTSPQYRKNLPIVSSDPVKKNDAS